jgi:hypothetical protein
MNLEIIAKTNTRNRTLASVAPRIQKLSFQRRQRQIRRAPQT